MIVWRYMVYLEYWTQNLMPLMVYPKLPLPPNFIILEEALMIRFGGIWSTLSTGP